MSNIDVAAVRRGAIGVLMFVLPVYVLVVIFATGDDNSLWWAAFTLALLFGSSFGGYAGARDRPPTPITHGALSVLVGLGAALAFGLLIQLVQGELGFTTLLTALVFLQIGTALGCLGALLAAKGARPR